MRRSAIQGALSRDRMAPLIAAFKARNLDENAGPANRTGAVIFIR
jgi:hypothetical protein